MNPIFSDSLGPIFSELLHALKMQSYSGVELSNSAAAEHQLPLANAISADTATEDQPLNMSLKKRKLEPDVNAAGGSQLREILTSGTSGMGRPMVLRYSHGTGVEGASNASSSSSHYPSSPGSQRSSSGSSAGAFAESPPRVGSPPVFDQNGPPPPAQNVPAFALHHSGQFYVPLSIRMSHLEGLAAKLVTEPVDAKSSARHTVTITVNFCATPAPPPPGTPSTSFPLHNVPSCSSSTKM